MRPPACSLSPSLPPRQTQSLPTSTTTTQPWSLVIYLHLLGHDCPCETISYRGILQTLTTPATTTDERQTPFSPVVHTVRVQAGREKGRENSPALFCSARNDVATMGGQSAPAGRRQGLAEGRSWQGRSSLILLFIVLSHQPPSSNHAFQIGRKLKARLALAQFKTVRGWEDLTLDTMEPKVEEELRKRRPTSSGDLLSDSSSSTTEYRYGQRHQMSSPLKGPVIFSDQLDPRSGSVSSSNGRRKRNYNSFEPPSSSAQSRKRFRSSPISARQSTHLSWKEDYQLPQSSPIKPRRHPHFTTSSGPDVSFYNHPSEDISSGGFTSPSDDDEDTLPVHSFNLRSSPRTPPPGRGRNVGRRKDKNGKSVDDGADLLLYLATSPSPAHPTRARMQPPSTPPPKNLALPSSMMTTPNQVHGLLGAFGGPNTPSQSFDFSDFVNITPSPAQTGFSKTPRTLQTPSTITRRRLTFENHGSPNINHSSRDATSAGRNATGLGVMQLGGDLNPR